MKKHSRILDENTYASVCSDMGIRYSQEFVDSLTDDQLWKEITNINDANNEEYDLIMKGTYKRYNKLANLCGTNPQTIARWLNAEDNYNGFHLHNWKEAKFYVEG